MTSRQRNRRRRGRKEQTPGRQLLPVLALLFLLVLLLGLAGLLLIQELFIDSDDPDDVPREAVMLVNLLPPEISPPTSTPDPAATLPNDAAADAGSTGADSPDGADSDTDGFGPVPSSTNIDINPNPKATSPVAGATASPDIPAAPPTNTPRPIVSFTPAMTSTPDMSGGTDDAPSSDDPPGNAADWPPGANSAPSQLLVSLDAARRPLVWAPDGVLLASAGTDRNLKIWLMPYGELLYDLPVDTRLLWAMAWSPDGLRLAVGVDDAAIHLLDIPSGEWTATLTGHDGDTIESLAWSPDGMRLASSGADQTVRVWDTTTYEQQQRIDVPYTMSALAWSPDGALLAGADSYNGVTVWDGHTLELISQIDPGQIFAHGMTWSPDSSALALLKQVGGRHQLQVWDARLPTLEVERDVGDHSEICFGMAWLDDGLHLAGGTEIGETQVWNTATAQRVTVLQGSQHPSLDPPPVMWVAWSPDALYIASADNDSNVWIWGP